MAALTVPLKAVQRFAMGRFMGQPIGLTVQRGGETKTIVEVEDGAQVIALYIEGADIPGPLALTAFEAIHLRMGDEYFAALAVFPSKAVKSAFLRQFSPTPPGTDLVLPVDLAQPIKGRNVHEPVSHGGFIVRWLGPGRTASLVLPNPVLARGWQVRGSETQGWDAGGLSLQMTMITHLDPAAAALAALLVEGQRVPVTLLQDGRAMRLFAPVPEEVLEADTLTLTLKAPAALCVFPEALKEEARALTFGLTSLSFHPEREAAATEAATPETAAPETADGPAQLAAFADAHAKTRAEISVDGERVVYEPPRRAEDGRLVAINTLAGRYLFPRIAIGPGKDDPVRYRVCDFLDENEDRTDVFDPAHTAGTPVEATLARLVTFFTSVTGAASTAGAADTAGATGATGTASGIVGRRG